LSCIEVSVYRRNIGIWLKAGYISIVLLFNHKSLTEFVLESACLAAEQTLLDQRQFMVSDGQATALLELLSFWPAWQYLATFREKESAEDCCRMRSAEPS